MSSEGAQSGAEACLVLRPPPSEGPWPQCAWRSWAGGAEGLQRTAHEGGAECSGSAPPPVNESLPSSTCPRRSRLTSKVRDLGACQLLDLSSSKSPWDTSASAMSPQ